ncbi:MAG: aminotransferase class V-fold PLP-dependent enzyme [Chloroflexia bacterium]|nr:aminotransferase class V-fold PLP-dependent enzyme [Chloroflexia bacterium]
MDQTYDYDLPRIRAALPALQDWTYFGTGTLGIMAEPILTKHLEYIRAFERDGMASRPRAVTDYTRARERVASLLGAEPSAVALLRNASDGVNLISAGLQLQPGDEVITTTEEGLELVIPFIAACQRSGARLRFVELTHDPDLFAKRLRAVTSTRTRLVIVSHVSCESGARAPVEIFREVVGQEVLIAIDAAQSVGQFPVDVRTLNADIVISNGHKWLCGPKGTGFTWFAPRALEHIVPVMVGYEGISPNWSRAHYQHELPPTMEFVTTADRFEMGTRAWHLYGALADAIDYQAGLGWDAIFSHVAAMSNLAKARLAAIPGVEIATPQRWEDSSGIVTFALQGQTGVDLSQRLREEYRITQRAVEIPSAVRISCAYFTSPADIDVLVHAIARIANQAATHMAAGSR